MKKFKFRTLLIILCLSIPLLGNNYSKIREFAKEHPYQTGAIIMAALLASGMTIAELKEWAVQYPREAKIIGLSALLLAISVGVVLYLRSDCSDTVMAYIRSIIYKPWWYGTGIVIRNNTGYNIKL